MKALVLQDNNSLPVLKEKEINGHSSDLKTKVLSSALNHRDLYITQGLYPGITTDTILGSDACVEHKGSQYVVNPNINWGENENVQSNDYQVLGMPSNGTFSEELYIPEDRLVPKPKHLDVNEAAALPLGGLTAYRAAIKKGKVNKGDKVLISGIGGGVALFALNFSLAAGADVYVTSSSQDKIDKAKEIGATGGVLYTQENWWKDLKEEAGGMDVIIDSAGGDGFKNFIPLCNPGARISIYGGTQGKITEINTQILFWRQITIHGTTMGSDSDFREMIEFVNEHKIVPVVDTIYDWNEYEKAFQRMNNSKQFGKIVLKIADE